MRIEFNDVDVKMEDLACELGEIMTSFFDNYPEEDEDEETD